MSEVTIFKINPKKLYLKEFSGIANALGIREKTVETEEALAVKNSTCALAYAQPGTKFGGLLFYTDQSQSVGKVAEKTVDIKLAKKWADDFLVKFSLLPKRTENKNIDFQFKTLCQINEGITFDGKERRKVKIKTEITSKTSINGISVTGPRAKIRMIFKEKEKPIMIHRGHWESIEVFEKRELVSEKEIVNTITDKLTKRKGPKGGNRIKDIKLAYFADEFKGAPDLLIPCYFIEVEFEDKVGKDAGIEQGPRHVFWLPAYR